MLIPRFRLTLHTLYLEVVYIVFVLLFHFQLVGQFIARAVSDQILSKNYIDGYKGRVDCEYARYVIY